MKTKQEITEFSDRYNQEKNQIITLINDLALKMQEDSMKLDNLDPITRHEVSMSTNMFDVSFSFQDVGCH